MGFWGKRGIYDFKINDFNFDSFLLICFFNVKIYWKND